MIRICAWRRTLAASACLPILLLVAVGCNERTAGTGPDLTQGTAVDLLTRDVATPQDLGGAAPDLATTDDLIAPADDLLTASSDLLAMNDLLPADDLLVTNDLLAFDLAPEPQLVICHIPMNDPLHPTLVSIDASAAAVHFDHGDPMGLATATTFVDAAAAPGGLGTEAQPLQRITDALVLQRCRYRATGERGRLELAPGVFNLSYDAATLADNPTYETGPIVIDFPVTVHGATTIPTDGGSRPVAGYDGYSASNATYVVAATPLAAQDAQSLLLIADTANVAVEGLILRSGSCHVSSLCPTGSTVSTWGGAGILVIRSTAVELTGNVAEPGFFAAFETWGSTATLRNNYASDTEICVSCISGPGRVDVLGNRFDNGLGGVFVGPTLANTPFSLGTQAAAFPIAQFTPQADLALDVTIDDNILSGHTRNGNAFGVRIVAYGRDTASKVTRQIVTAHVRNNRVENDNGSAGASQGVLIDAGFSDRLASVLLTATMFIDLLGNTLHTTDKPIAVMTMRAQTLLGGAASQWKQYGPLETATIVVDSDAVYPDDFRVDHLAADPLADKTTAGGSCTTDADCSTATYRSKALPGLCNASKICQCLPGLVDTTGTCTDPRPTSNVIVINSKLIAPGTAIP